MQPCRASGRGWLWRALRRIHCIPASREFLQWAHGQGKKLIVATSKTSRIARGALERCGILGDFDMVAGKDEAGGAGEKAAVIAYVLEHFPGIQKEECVMIGDRKYDILGARETGMDAIARALWLWFPGGTGELLPGCPLRKPPGCEEAPIDMQKTTGFDATRKKSQAAFLFLNFGRRKRL